MLGLENDEQLVYTNYDFVHKSEIDPPILYRYHFVFINNHCDVQVTNNTSTE